MKQFDIFNAVVPENFTELMIGFWMESENATRDQVIDWYFNDEFFELSKRVSGQRCEFKPDLGYVDESVNGTVCFEVEDNNFVIPISILAVIK